MILAVRSGHRFRYSRTGQHTRLTGFDIVIPGMPSMGASTWLSIPKKLWTWRGEKAWSERAQFDFETSMMVARKHLHPVPVHALPADVHPDEPELDRFRGVSPHPLIQLLVPAGSKAEEVVESQEVDLEKSKCSRSHGERPFIKTLKKPARSMRKRAHLCLDAFKLDRERTHACLRSSNDLFSLGSTQPHPECKDGIPVDLNVAFVQLTHLGADAAGGRGSAICIATIRSDGPPQAIEVQVLRDVWHS